MAETPELLTDGEEPENDYFTINQLDLIEKLAGLGCTYTDMAYLLDIGRTTFWRRLKKHQEVEEAFERGKARAKVALLKTMHETAMNGDFRALAWSLSVWHGVGSGPRPADNPFSSMTWEELCKERESLKKINEEAVARLPAQQIGTGQDT